MSNASPSEVTSSTQVAGPTVLGPGPAAILLLVFTLYLGLYVALAGLGLHFAALYGGFLLVYYWTGPKESAPAAFLPSIVGGLTGFALAAAQYYLPLAFGTTGIAIGLGLILFAIWLLIQGRLPTFLNPAAMLTLTVAAIPMLLTPQFLFEATACFMVMAAFLVPLWLWLRRQGMAQAAIADTVTST